MDWDQDVEMFISSIIHQWQSSDAHNMERSHQCSGTSIPGAIEKQEQGFDNIDKHVVVTDDRSVEETNAVQTRMWN